MTPRLFRRRLRLGSHCAFDGNECLFGQSSLGPAGLSQVGATTATLAPERFGAEADQFDRIEAAGQIRGDADDDRCLPVGARDDRDDTRTDATLKIVGQGFELASGHAVDQTPLERDFADAFFGRFRAGACTG